ncbi:MAG: LD-carboxypeptidase [Acidobacteriales bacterium]|nr:LD-carboxypeptidase [Terriglobales bacterium]
MAEVECPPPIQRVKPTPLAQGDTVGIVAPASWIDPAMLEAGCQALRNMGYTPFYFDSILDRDLFFAGTVERRARELEEMFTRDEVRAIVCARGGYGSNYLLKALNPARILAHPKIFVGYSDITFLLTYLAETAGLVTFHGPMVAKDFAHTDGVDVNSWEAALTGVSQWSVDTANVEPVVEGSAEGIFYGGCLSMLTASLGTTFGMRTEGTILFLEDVGTKPYQIDRMLMQWRLAGKFDGVRGIVFGPMQECVQPGGQDHSLQQIVARAVGDLGIPVAYGLRSGHVASRNITLPIGVAARLHVGKNDVTLEFSEAATGAAPPSDSVHD